MKTFLSTLFFLITIPVLTYAQRVSINTDGSAAHESAILDVKSDSLGILVPRMHTSDRDGILNPAEGLLIYNIDSKSFWLFDGNQWDEMAPLSKVSSLQDADRDTKVDVEQTTDDDLVRFYQAGVEYFRMDSGRLEVTNTGQSVFIGEEAGRDDDFTNNYNTAVGHYSLRLNVNGYQNAALGWKSLAQSTTGHSNTALGSYSMYNTTKGNWNAAVGRLSLYKNKTGLYNAVLGFNAMRENDSGSQNVALGSYALHSNTEGNNLVAVGDSALYSNGLGVTEHPQSKNNTAVGAKSMAMNTIGDHNAAFGYHSLWNNIDGRLNTAIGTNAMSGNLHGVRNTAVGNVALGQNIDGSANVAMGNGTMVNTETGSENTALGTFALFSNVSGNANIAIGRDALYHAEDRDFLVAIGDSAMFNNGSTVVNSYDGTANTAIGSKAMFNNNTGYYNTALGYQSLYTNVEGFHNTAVGREALYSNTGNGSTAIGYRSLYNASGPYNTAVGVLANYNLTGGNSNTVVGVQADYFNVSGEENTIIGMGAGQNTGAHSKDGCVFVGYKAGFYESGDDKLYIDNSSTSTPLIYGDFFNNELGLYGNVGVNTKTPGEELHILDGGDGGSTATIRMQSAVTNTDCNIDFYENTLPAMSIYYSGISNKLQLVDLTGDTVRVTFERTGDVGIANEYPTHLLDVGTSGAFCDGGVWINGSSREYKTDILSISTAEALEVVNVLEPVRYRYKSSPEEEHLGFIAEDVPDLVATNDHKGMAAMDVVAVLTKAVQDLTERVEVLEEEVRRLREERMELSTESE